MGKDNVGSYFELAHSHVAQWEGKISNDKDDRGGYTVYGVSRSFLKGEWETGPGRRLLMKHGLRPPFSNENMNSITPAIARDIFFYKFWEWPNIKSLPFPVNVFAYDSAVNHGDNRAVKLVQEACNKALPELPALIVDGAIGPITLAACEEAPGAVAKEAIPLRAEYYRLICANRPLQKKFLKGWLNRLNSLKGLLSPYL